MLVVYNGNTFVNTDNVTRATVEGKTISFYLTSSEHYHLSFATKEIAKTMFDEIVNRVYDYRWFDINSKGVVENEDD